MMTLPKDYTAQENIIAECLSEFGLRYDQQYELLKYTVDFWIPEICLIIEADGVHGHLKKRDTKRDLALIEGTAAGWVLHLSQTTKKEIKEMIWQALNRL